MKTSQQNILVIGSNSFLANKLITRLKSYSTITGVYHSTNDLHQKNINYLNVSNLDTLEDNFDIVYFISAYIPYGGVTDHNRLFEVNVRLVETVVEKFKSAHIVYTSSVSVYGQFEGIISENSSCKNTSAYGLSKLWAESIIKNHPSWSIHRISSMYGNEMKKTTFLPLIIVSAIRERKIILAGNGLRQQNYIHVDDVAESLVTSGLSKIKGCYLSVAEESTTNLFIAQIVQNVLKDTFIEFSGEDISDSYIYNAKNTYKELGWRCKTDLKAGIKELIKWIEKEY